MDDMTHSAIQRIGRAALVLAALGLAGCNKERPPGVYDVSVSEAYRRLFNDKLADMVYAKQCGILVHVTPSGIPGYEVTWRVHSSGREVVRFTAVLTAFSENQTKVEIRMPSAGNGEAYDGSQSYRRPAFQQPLRPAVQEQVAAILEGRKFDVQRVGPGKDKICQVQRAGLETGLVFRVDD
ncbi:MULTISPECIES: hypothetical protein [unclassified Bradyrhizobium]|uniref:hypothetical protein n=1 Tax=unclassified Bradyrhizobium TaxID=2631580 RepID=UPI0012EB2580|nr:MULTISPECIES: hypothetical protein [unclassified Bradyrhizobium]QIG93232.1 hypothetical protein G6P99_12495 [Bradyrhizobium sp. 6(2017)]